MVFDMFLQIVMYIKLMDPENGFIVNPMLLSIFLSLEIIGSKLMGIGKEIQIALQLWLIYIMILLIVPVVVEISLFTMAWYI